MDGLILDTDLNQDQISVNQSQDFFTDEEMKLEDWIIINKNEAHQCSRRFIISGGFSFRKWVSKARDHGDFEFPVFQDCHQQLNHIYEQSQVEEQYLRIWRWNDPSVQAHHSSVHSANELF